MKKNECARCEHGLQLAYVEHHTQKTLERIEKLLEVQVEQNSALIAQNAALIEQGDYHIPSPTREQMQNARGDDE